MSPDGLGILERELQPSVHQASAHGRERLVDDIEQALALATHRGDELEVAHGELVEPDISLGLDARQRGDVPQLGVLGDVEVVEDGAGGHNGTFHRVDAEPLERSGLKVLEQPVAGRLEVEHPVVHLLRQIAHCGRVLEVLAVGALDEHLLGLEVAQQLVDIVDGPLCCHKLTGADVQECHTQLGLAEVHRGQEVVLLAVEDVAAQHHTRRDQLGDAAFDQLLGQLGILKLVADGHALASPHELGQVGVQGMVRKSGHLGVAAGAVAAPRQCDAQNLAGDDCVLHIGLIEVAAAEQQYRIGMLRLHLEELPHHRRYGVVLCHVSVVSL